MGGVCDITYNFKNIQYTYIIRYYNEWIKEYFTLQIEDNHLGWDSMINHSLLFGDHAIWKFNKKLALSKLCYK